MNQFANKALIIRGRQYQIQSLIGEGSHSTVWCAQGRFYPHDTITVKIAKDKDGIAHERVENEIFFLKEVSHPHIPPLLDYGAIADYLWLAMPLYQKLTIHLPRRARLVKIPVADIRPQGYPSYVEKIPLQYREAIVLGVLADIGAVIFYLAGTGIVHADISPGNVMEKIGSLVKKHYFLTDWGASALIHRYPANTFGSLHFTAPERLLGEIDPKSDIFSLGVTSFYILTGRVPYGGENGEIYYRNAVERDGISPSEICPGITSSLDKLIRDMIRHNPQHRLDAKELRRKVPPSSRTT
jgi:serine/threonine protein kinase